MPTDCEPGWMHRKRLKYQVPRDDTEGNPLPHLVYLSDLLKGIDEDRQTGYNEDDLPPQFTCPKSFAKVPHHLLGQDGYPLDEHWDDPTVLPYLTEGKKKKTSLKEDKYVITREKVGPEVIVLESLPPPTSCPPPLLRPDLGVKKPRHPRRARAGIAARTADVSPTCQSKKDGNPYNKEFKRFDDPVLPVGDYERTMKIVSKLYHIVSHGHGQFVDMDTKKLICTFAYEDLDTMKDDTRKEHQSDVETVMKATKIFGRMPLPPRSKGLGTLSRSSEDSSKSVSTSSPLAQSADSILCAASSAPLESSKLKPGIDVKRQSAGPTSIVDSNGSSPLTSLPSSDSDEGIPLPNQPVRMNNRTKKRTMSCTIKLLHEELQSLLSNEIPRSSGTISSPLTSLDPSDVEQEEAAGLSIPKVQSKPNTKKVRKKLRPTTNGALIQGRMFCFGNRAGYDKAVLYAPYLPRQGASIQLYKLFLSELPNFGKNIGSRYQTFADQAFFTAHTQLKTLRVPPLSSISKDDPPSCHDFAGNFAFTFHNFFNKPHTDNDKGKVYCVWYPIDSVSGRIMTNAEGFTIEGGFFLFPEYRIAFNFGTKFVVQICWSGKSTFHQTIASKETEAVGREGNQIHYTRLGCSSQITSSLARAAVKFGTAEQYNFTSNCEREVLDCNDVLKLKGKKWKE